MSSIEEYKYLKKYIKMIGLDFFVKHIEDIIPRYEYLKKTEYKENYIIDMLKKEPQINYAGMIMRINGMLKIIENDYVSHALTIAKISNRLDASTKQYAGEILKNINKEKN